MELLIILGRACQHRSEQVPKLAQLLEPCPMSAARDYCPSRPAPDGPLIRPGRGADLVVAKVQRMVGPSDHLSSSLFLELGRGYLQSLRAYRRVKLDRPYPTTTHRGHNSSGVVAQAGGDPSRFPTVVMSVCPLSPCSYFGPD